MIIDVSTLSNIQSKKFDYVRIAFILTKIEGSISANQINFYFNHLFPQTYCNTQRIAQIIKQKKHLFSISDDPDKFAQAKTYSYSGIIKLNKTTQYNWNNKSRTFFTTP